MAGGAHTAPSVPAHVSRGLLPAIVAAPPADLSLVDVWFRLQLLQRLTGELAAAHTAADAADAVTALAREQLDAASVVVLLADPDGMLRSVSRRGDAELWGERYRTIALEARLPASDALRTGRTIVLPDRAALQAAYPELAGAYDDDRAVHVAPLIAGDARLGVLSLTFLDGSAFCADSQRDFVAALADALAQALERVQALERARAANERLSFLADASVALSATLDYQETVDAVTGLLVPRLADWCLVQVLDGEELRTVGLLHVDPDKVRWAEQIDGRYPSRRDAAHGPPNVVRTGRSELIAELTDAEIVAAAHDAEHLALIREVGISSVLTTPLTGRRGTFGAVTLIYAESGRRYGEQDLPFVEDVARRAALALENALAFQEQATRLADVSEVNARLGLLARLSEVMTGVGSQSELFERLTQMLVTTMADWATVVVPDGQTLVRIAASHRDPSLDGLAQRLVGTYPHALSGPSPGVLVYRTGQPLRLPLLARHITDALDDSTASAAYGRTLQLLGDGPGLIVPVTIDGAVAAVLTLVRTSRPEFTDSDLASVVELADRVAGLLHEARGHEVQREAAAALQEAALPKSLPLLDTLRVAAGYRPASAGGQVGGDWYDAVELVSGRIALIVGDAAGHGLQAAAVMTQLRNALRAHLSAGFGPAEALGHLGSFVAAQEPEVFATILCVEIDPASGQLSWASAGHPAPILVGPDGSCQNLPGSASPPIGVAHDSPRIDHRHRLEGGARLLMFSDGLVERRGLDLDIGLTHLMFLAEQTAGSVTPADVCASILRQMLPAAHEDDVCLLVADYGLAGTTAPSARVLS